MHVLSHITILVPLMMVTCIFVVIPDFSLDNDAVSGVRSLTDDSFFDIIYVLIVFYLFMVVIVAVCSFMLVIVICFSPGRRIPGSYSFNHKIVDLMYTITGR